MAHPSPREFLPGQAPERPDPETLAARLAAAIDEIGTARAALAPHDGRPRDVLSAEFLDAAALALDSAAIMFLGELRRVLKRQAHPRGGVTFDRWVLQVIEGGPASSAVRDAVSILYGWYPDGLPGAYLSYQDYREELTLSGAADTPEGRKVLEALPVAWDAYRRLYLTPPPRSARGKRGREWRLAVVWPDDTEWVGPVLTSRGEAEDAREEYNRGDRSEGAAMLQYRDVERGPWRYHH